LKRPKDLNGSKFRTKRIHPSLPVELERVREVLPEHDDARQRMFLFLIGATPRYLQQATQSIGGLDECILGRGSLSSSDQQDHEKEFLRSLEAAMWERNIELFASMDRN
jgi:hypothetical protein